MCDGCLSSWRPPVVFGFLVAFALIPFGIDLTFEAYKDGPPVALVSGTNSTTDDMAKVYEGPVMVSVGVFCAIVGLIFGAIGYKRQKELEAEAKLRAQREAWELQQGPPSEFMPQPKIAKLSEQEQDQCQDPEAPETEDVAGSHPTPSLKPPTEVSPTVCLIESEDGLILDSADLRDMPDGEIRRSSGDLLHPEIKPEETAIPQGIPPDGYRKAMDGDYHWIGSMCDLSTVGEEVCGEADNLGFESDEFGETDSSIKLPSTNDPILNNAHRGKARLDSDENTENYGMKTPSTISTRTQRNIKSTSRGNASSNNNGNNDFSHGRGIFPSIKFEDEVRPEISLTISKTNPEGKSSRDQRRKRDRTSNGSSSEQKGSTRWGMELLSSSGKPCDEQLTRMQNHNARKYKDSGFYDSEADSTDLDLFDRPSAPDPGHRRNTREKSKTAANKQLQKGIRNYPNRSSTNVDFLEEDRHHHEDRYYGERYNDSRTAYDDRYSYPTEDGDSVFYDSPELRRQYQQYESPVVIGSKDRSQARQTSKNITESLSGRQHSDNSKDVILNARILELKQHQRSSSNPSPLPHTSSESGSERDRLRDRNKRMASRSPRSTAPERVGDGRRRDVTSYDVTRSYNAAKVRRKRMLPTPPPNDHGQRHRVRSDGSTPRSNRRKNADGYARQRSTTSDVTSNKSKYYDEEISA